jgi:D-aminopeptidase
LDKSKAKSMRCREIGLQFEGQCGAKNCITDVIGVEVGLRTVIEGADCRTGVTCVFPRGREMRNDPVHASVFVLNGNGEMTGTQIVADLGFLHGPLAITNTNQVGLVRDSIVEWLRSNTSQEPWSCPLVSETWDGRLNNIEANYLKQQHVFDALDAASRERVLNGNTGGGTGMVCFELKVISCAWRLMRD